MTIHKCDNPKCRREFEEASLLKDITIEISGDESKAELCDACTQQFKDYVEIFFAESVEEKQQATLPISTAQLIDEGVPIA